MRRLVGFGIVIMALGSAHCSRRKVETHQVETSSASSAAEVPSAPAESMGPTASEPELPTVTGEELLTRVARSGRRATLVNAWASWCGPCVRELPMLQAMAVNLEPREVGFVLVSVDEPEQAPKALAFLQDHQITLPSYLAARPLGPFKLALNPRWPGMLPATFLFDAAGKLRYFWGGAAAENEILPIVEGFLAGKNIDGEANFVVTGGPGDP